MKFVEFFGLPGVGKTTVKNLLKKKLISEKVKVYDYKNIILKFSEKTIKLSTKEKLALKYFKFIKSQRVKKLKTNLKKTKKVEKEKKYKSYFTVLGSFHAIYRKICFNIFKKFKKENKEFVNYVINTINNSTFSNKQKLLMNNWFIEDCSAIYLAKKNRDKIDLILDSEGFIHRSMLYFCNEKTNKVHNKIKKYINYSPLPNIIFYVEKKNKYPQKILGDSFDISKNTQKKTFNLIYYYLKKKISKEKLDIILLKFNNNKKNIYKILKIKKKLMLI